MFKDLARSALAGMIAATALAFFHILLKVTGLLPSNVGVFTMLAVLAVCGLIIGLVLGVVTWMIESRAGLGKSIATGATVSLVLCFFLIAPRVIAVAFSGGFAQIFNVTFARNEGSLIVMLLTFGLIVGFVIGVRNRSLAGS